MKDDHVELQVKEAYPQDVLHGMARISSEIMALISDKQSKEIVVEIKGKRTTAAICHPLNHNDECDGIRIDKIIRENAGIKIGDTVQIKKITISPALEVVLRASPIIPDDKYLKNVMENMVVTRGDKIVVKHNEQRITLEVLNILPITTHARTNKKTKLVLIESLTSHESTSKNYSEEISQLISKADFLIDSEQYADALEVADRILDKDSSNAKALNMKGFTLQMLGKNHNVKKYYQAALALPTEPVLKSAILCNLGRNRGGLDLVSRYLAINEKNAQAWLIKGIALQNLKRYNEALDCYNQSLKINPKNKRAIRIKSMLLSAMEQMGVPVCWRCNNFIKGKGFEPIQHWHIYGKLCRACYDLCMSSTSFYHAKYIEDLDAERRTTNGIVSIYTANGITRILFEHENKHILPIVMDNITKCEKVVLGSKEGQDTSLENLDLTSEEFLKIEYQVDDEISTAVFDIGKELPEAISKISIVSKD